MRGVRQADAIFAADLDRLNAMLEGIARWGTLHDARMVGAPRIEVSRSATSGDGQVMRVGETLVRLGRPAELQVQAREWRGFVFRNDDGAAGAGDSGVGGDGTVSDDEVAGGGTGKVGRRKATVVHLSSG